MKIEGIILAAGFSKRAGTFKMTLDFNGKTIIENVIDNMSHFTDRIIVVGGYKIENLKPVVQKYKNTELVFNEDYENGMFSSVKKGVSQIKGDRFFLTPGDYPLIESYVYRELLKCSKDIVIPVYKSKKGHPVLISSSIKDKIFNEKYESLRDFINDNTHEFIETDCKGILIDIDTMDDYWEILKNFAL